MTSTIVISIAPVLLGGGSIYLVQWSGPHTAARIEPPPASKETNPGPTDEN